MRAFDTKAIFAAAGGASALRRALLAECGKAPDITAIYMWGFRNRIAAPWLADCIVAVLRNHPELTALDLMSEAVPPAPAPPPVPRVFPPYTGELDY